MQVHAHMQHGDPMTNAFVERQMRALATPLLDMVKQWVTEGQLTDPYEVYSIYALCLRVSCLQSSPPYLTHLRRNSSWRNIRTCRTSATGQANTH